MSFPNESDYYLRWIEIKHLFLIQCFAPHTIHKGSLSIFYYYYSNLNESHEDELVSITASAIRVELPHLRPPNGGGQEAS